MPIKKMLDRITECPVTGNEGIMQELMNSLKNETSMFGRKSPRKFTGIEIDDKTCKI